MLQRIYFFKMPREGENVPRGILGRADWPRVKGRSWIDSFKRRPRVLGGFSFRNTRLDHKDRELRN